MSTYGATFRHCQLGPVAVSRGSVGPSSQPNGDYGAMWDVISYKLTVVRPVVRTAQLTWTGKLTKHVRLALNSYAKREIYLHSAHLKTADSNSSYARMV